MAETITNILTIRLDPNRIMTSLQQCTNLSNNDMLHVQSANVNNLDSS